MSSQLTSLLDKYAAKLKIQRVKRNAWLILTLLVLPLCLFGALDVWLIFSVPMRVLALTLVVLLAIWALFLLLRPKPDKLTTARLLDHRLSPGSYAITTAWQLSGLAQDDPLKPQEQQQQALDAYAKKSLQQLNFNNPPANKWLIAASVLGLSGIGGMLASNQQLALQRILQPYAQLDYTRISLQLPATTPAANEKFKLQIAVKGQRDANIMLSVKNLQDNKLLHGYPKQVALPADGKLDYEFLQGLNKDSIIEVKAGRGNYVAATTLQLRATPQLKQLKYTITYPEYAKHLNRTESNASFAILRGCKVKLDLELSGQATGCNLVKSGRQAEVIELQAVKNATNTYSSALAYFDRSFDYRFSSSDRFGTYEFPQQLQQIIVNEDQPPEISITSNNAESLKVGDSKLKLAYEASDDVGLARINLVYEVVGKPASRQQRPLQINALQASENLEVDFKAMGAQPMDTVVVFMEVFDGNNLYGPGKVASEPIMFEVPLPEQPKDEEQKQQGSGEGENELHNPLEIQRGIYKDTLRKYLGNNNKQGWQELAKRQQDNTRHLGDMQNAPEIQGLGEEFLKIIKECEQLSLQSAESLRKNLGMESREIQSQIIKKLIDAARIQANAKQPEQPEQPQDKQEQQGQPQKSTKYSLIKPGGGKQKEQQDEEQARQKLAELNALAKQQEQLAEKLNQELQKKNEEMFKKMQQQNQQQNQNPPNMAGQKPGEKDGEQAGGKQPGEQGKPSPDGSGMGKSTSQQQDDILARTQEMLQELEKMRLGENQLAPQSALDDLSKAIQQQKGVKDSLGDPHNIRYSELNARSAARQLGNSAEKLKAALSQATGSMSNGSRPANGYEQLIIDYTRRLSYEQ